MAEIWGAAIVAAGAIGGAVISSSAAKGAANAQVSASQNANQTQLAELQATAGLQTPGRNLGYGADSLLAQLYGLPDPNAASTTNSYAANGSLAGIGGLPTSLTGSGTANVSGPLIGGAAAPLGTTGTGAGTASAPGGYSAFGGGTVNPGTAPGMATAQATGPQTPAGAAPATAGGTLPANAPAGASSAYSGFYNSPGYQFTLGAGEQAINSAASANGNLYSSNTLNSLGNYAEGTASTQYNNYVSQLMGLAGLGAGATNQTTASATTAGNNISANQLSAGNAEASGILGQGGAFGGAVTNTGGALGNYSLLSQNSTPNLGYQTVGGGYVIPGVTQNGGQGGSIGNIVGDI